MTIIELMEDFRERFSRPRPRPPRFRIATSLAAAMVPVHGFVINRSAMHSGMSKFAVAKSQAKMFFGQLIKGCLWAAAIAAGMLVYTSFTAKWKEKGWPTIPISALVAADQAMTGPRQTTIPLGGTGSTYTNGVRPVAGNGSSTSSTTRQTSLLDLDEYEG